MIAGQLFGIVLEVIALQLDELLESEPAESHTSAGILPAGPGKILQSY